MNGFACTQCGACCSNLGAAQTVLVLASDRRRIAGFLGLSVGELETAFLEPNVPLSTALEKNVYSPRHHAGRCVFLGADNRCAVHPVKPRQCREGPDGFMASSMTAYPCMKDVALTDTRATDRDFFITLLTEEE